jgi:uncharacterized membrane protein YccC
LITPRYAIFSLNSYLAALLALFIGFSLDLPRPYWAMLTVYITAQPLTGALRSKALYRVLGTVLGGAAAVLLVPALVNTPFLLCLALAGWAGGCLYLSLLDRTPRAYVFMLAGYTAAIIGFPSVNAPGVVFETAVARVEEITLGILCATVVHTIIFPRDVAGALNDQVAVYLADARRWIWGALMGEHGETEARERGRLASDLTALQLLSTHLPFDTAHHRPRMRAVRALQDRLAVLLPLLSGVEDRMRALGEMDASPPGLTQLAADVADWARDEAAPRQAALDLQARCEALSPRLARADWASLLEASAITRLSQLIAALRESRELAAFIVQPSGRAPAHLDPLVRRRSRRPLHRDHGLAALSAFALMMAVLACCAFWIFSAWPDGAIAAMMAAVFSSFYATQDDPSPALASFLGWTIAALPFAAIYLFAILPAIDGFPLLAASIAPAFLLLGYMQADPRHTAKAMPLIIGIAGSLSLQAVFTADFPGFVNASLAQVVGIAAALFATRLFRGISAGWSARRLLRRGWRDIADLATTRRDWNREAWTSAMLDRLGLLAPRLALADDEALEATDSLADMRVGLNVIDIKTAGRALAGPDAAAVTAALAAVAAFYRARAVGQPPHPDATVLEAVDTALSRVEGASDPDQRQRGLIALAGLRRSLFPAAAPYAPRTPA